MSQQPRFPYARLAVTQISFGALLILTMAASVFAYQVSPLRDPSFEPNSANAGSLVPWLQGMTEGDWFWGAFILAALLAANGVLLLWQLSQPHRPALSQPDRPAWFNAIAQSLRVGAWLGFGLLLFGGFWIAFMAHLMTQWLID